MRSEKLGRSCLIVWNSFDGGRYSAPIRRTREVLQTCQLRSAQSLPGSETGHRFGRPAAVALSACHVNRPPGCASGWRPKQLGRAGLVSGRAAPDADADPLILCPRAEGSHKRARIAYHQQTRFVRRYLRRTSVDPLEQRKVSRCPRGLRRRSAQDKPRPGEVVARKSRIGCEGSPPLPEDRPRPPAGGVEVASSQSQFRIPPGSAPAGPSTNGHGRRFSFSK